MSVEEDIVRRHADLIAEEALARARRRLRALSSEQQRAVEELVDAVADGISGLLLEECERRPELATIYRKGV
jgi:hypothetical protein